MMRRSFLSIAVVLVAMSGLNSLAASVPTRNEPASSGSVRVIQDVELPSGLRFVRDVRFESESSVLLAAGRPGVFRFNLATRESTAVVPGTGPGSFFFSARLARTRSTLLVASAFIALTWRGANGDTQEPFLFDAIVDVDIYGDRVALIGARKDDAGRWNPEKGVVWTGTLSSKLSDLSPLITTEKEGASDPVNGCHYFELGALRYLDDGSLFVVPGVQPGIFLYGPDGRLKRTWDSGTLGFQDRCDLSIEEVQLFASQGPPRWKWLEKRAVLDDVLDLPGGPALVIRKVEKGRTSWDLVRLASKTSTERLPFHSPNPNAHLRADVRLGKIAFVIIEYAMPGEPPPAPPRVILAEVTR
ncbi:MAG: hypothetical protein NDJ92_14000 [Thermoanaerobaculia bacterium]|nr:hypothetical protein [Thermoanaerobaculia bacterium]